MIHEKLLIAFGDESFMFLTYQLSMVHHYTHAVSVSVSVSVFSMFFVFGCVCVCVCEKK